VGRRAGFNCLWRRACVMCGLCTTTEGVRERGPACDLRSAPCFLARPALSLAPVRCYGLGARSASEGRFAILRSALQLAPAIQALRARRTVAAAAYIQAASFAIIPMEQAPLPGRGLSRLPGVFAALRYLSHRRDCRGSELPSTGGAQKIADRIERTPRAVYHLIETGQLPVKKIGRRICTTEDALIKLFSMPEGN
jgi:hypothetical protein